MKTIILFLSLVFFGCQSDSNDDVSEIDKLPPITQTGENTIGCLLDGRAFLPANSQNPFDCLYQFVNGQYHFALQFNREKDGNRIMLGCATEGLAIVENQTYQLKEYVSGNAYAIYFYNTMFSYTSALETGEMTIAKFDIQQGIVSGTFWYDIKDHNGVVHQIREGRFDMLFTQ